jgi:hypothetical protein
MKTRTDFVKLSFIQMKIYDDNACSMNWIQISLKINGMQIGARGIENLLTITIWIFFSRKAH